MYTLAIHIIPAEPITLTYARIAAMCHGGITESVTEQLKVLLVRTMPKKHTKMFEGEPNVCRFMTAHAKCIASASTIIFFFFFYQLLNCFSVK